MVEPTHARTNNVTPLVDAPSLKVVVDSNAFDDFADDDAPLAVVTAAVEAGELELLVTPYQWMEIEATPNPPKVTRLLRLPVTTESPVWVWGYTAWGEGCWGDAAIAATFDDAKGEKVQHYVDAQTLVTALRLGVPLVTNDKHLIKKALRNGVDVLSSQQVLDMVTRHHSPPEQQVPWSKST